MEGKPNNVFEETIGEVSSYARMRFDAAKLDAVDGLSKLFASIIGILMLVIFAIVALIMLFGVLGYWIGTLVDSIPWGLVITAGFLLIVGWVLYALRHRLFGDPMVRMFAKIFFRTKQEDGDGQQ